MITFRMDQPVLLISYKGLNFVHKSSTLPKNLSKMKRLE